MAIIIENEKSMTIITLMASLIIVHVFKYKDIAKFNKKKIHVRVCTCILIYIKHIYRVTEGFFVINYNNKLVFI